MIRPEIQQYEVLDRDDGFSKCCDNPSIIKSEGYFVCKNCGVQSERVYKHNRGYFYKYKDDVNTKQNEKVYSRIGPRTVINGYRDGKGSELKPLILSRYRRLAKINRGFRNGYERNLWIAFPIFNKYKFTLNIPQYIEQDVMKIYLYIAKQKLALGRTIDAMMAASVYVGLKINEIAISIEEIADIGHISKQALVKGYQIVFSEVLPNLNLSVTSYSPYQYINQITSQMKLTMRVRKTAINLLRKAEAIGLNFSGKDPKGIAAASIYLSSKICEEDETQKNICKYAKVSEATLRVRKKEIKKFLK
ncbi:MAG: hypothetical protein GF383_16235 [Candidatus Lokiarchaeota archaeon]|nr:hypothetical protein [Candidatus Lokiarchaeota archaeon]MBD3343299.1 hypothetical protein [Candidatus Lokiarchaeota archaeon]